MTILSVKNLKVEYYTKKDSKNLVDGISFDVKPGECLGILGESGSGKSMTCKAILGLLPETKFRLGGSVDFQGQDLLSLKSEHLREIRGRKICMILQNPMSCFDPLMRIDAQIKETLEENTELSGDDIRRESIRILELMRIHNPEEVLKKYPHQLSGGMLQRIMIGMALITKPDLIVADEPTTAIDSITQYEIINELLRIKKETNIAMIFISHDLGVVSKLADRVIVMYRSQVVQSGDLQEVYTNPVDGYTRELIGSKMAVLNQFNEAVR